jgi:uncharacterized protein
MTSADDPLAAHRALVEKVDAFSAGVHARRAASMACRPGCSACCQVELTVCDVEAAQVREGLRALDVVARDSLRARLDPAEDEPAENGGPCVMLGDDGRCAIYAARPLVCRTQGLPLRYPRDTVPVDAVMGRARGTGDPLTWCPLNFHDGPPEPVDVLDAERVDAMIAVSNRAYLGGMARTRAEEPGRTGDPTRRVALRTLAREITG